MTKEDARIKWETADRAAVEAEAKVAAIGQAAQDPRVAELFRTAAQLRAEADRLFQELVEPDQD
ncbi:hypothetical protein WG902_17175 [Ramlibacter sp. PS3R-8]|uniref:hypothetical protein n=1 Tax=Ramlibacter sp. PS3R-8 TaxID=3133437 RepID=UPI0030A5AC89